MKFLSLSVVSIALTNSGFAGAEVGCLKVVQLCGSIGIIGAQGKYKVDANKAIIEFLKQMKTGKKDNNNNDIMVIGSDGKLNGFREINPNDVKIKKGELGEVKSDGELKFISKTEEDPVLHNVKWEITSANVTSKAANTISDIQSADGKQYITITTKNTFTGAADQIYPIKGDATAVNNAIAAANNGNPPAVDGQSETSTQNIYLTVDPTNITKYGFDSPEFYKFITNWNEKNTLPGSINGWDGKLFGEVGFKLNSSYCNGAALVFSLFGGYSIINSTQKIEFGKEADSSSKSEKEESDNNSSTNSNNAAGWQFDIKEKGHVGVYAGLLVPFSEKFELGIGGGVQWTWYESSASDNKENDDNSTSTENKTYFLKQKQNMKGWAPFIELSLHYVFTQNLGLKVFARWNMSSVLKETDAKSSDDDTKSTDNTNSGFSQTYTKLSSPSFGLAFTFRF